MATGFTMLTDAYDLRCSSSSLKGELWCIGLTGFHVDECQITVDQRRRTEFDRRVKAMSCYDFKSVYKLGYVQIACNWGFEDVAWYAGSGSRSTMQRWRPFASCSSWALSMTF